MERCTGKVGSTLYLIPTVALHGSHVHICFKCQCADTRWSMAVRVARRHALFSGDGRGANWGVAARRAGELEGPFAFESCVKHCSLLKEHQKQRPVSSTAH
jgi:hypothetical protein